MDNQTEIKSETQSPTPEVSNAPEQPTKPYGRNWKKWILIYLLIGAIVYAGVYYFVLAKQDSKPYSQPVMKAAPSSSITPDPTADWKTYINQADNFLVKYPDEWKVREDNVNNTIFFESPDYTTPSNTGMSLSTQVSTTDKTDVEQWFSDYRAKLEVTKNQVGGSERIIEETIRRTKIAEVAAIQYDAALQAGSVNTVFIKNDKLYSIGFVYTNKQLRDANKKTYDQILQTFKFTQ